METTADLAITPEHIQAAELNARAIAAESRVAEMVKKLRALFIDYTFDNVKVKYLDKKYLPSEAPAGAIFTNWKWDRQTPYDFRMNDGRDKMLDFGKLKKYIDEIIAIKPIDPWDQIYDIARSDDTFNTEMEFAYRARVHELTEKLNAMTTEMKFMREKHNRESYEQENAYSVSKEELIGAHKSKIQRVKTKHQEQIDTITREHKKFVGALYLKLKPNYSEYTSKIIKLNEDILTKDAIIAEKTAENAKLSELKQQLEQSQTQIRSLSAQATRLDAEKQALVDKIVENGKLTNELINKLAAANEDVAYLHEKLSAFEQLNEVITLAPSS